MNTPALWTIKSAAKRVKELEARNAELLAMLKTVLDDSKLSTDHYGQTTVDEDAVEGLIAKAKGWE